MADVYAPITIKLTVEDKSYVATPNPNHYLVVGYGKSKPEAVGNAVMELVRYASPVSVQRIDDRTQF